MKKRFSFKGANYEEDCGIYISEFIQARHSNDARLQREGVVIEIEESKAEQYKRALQSELNHPVRVFKQAD